MTEDRSAHEVTSLLRAWSAGDENALHELVPLVYNDLHRAARRYMSNERFARTIQTTGLINEVYLRVVDIRHVEWQDRVHFLAVCARLMRRILVDFARSRGYKKRGGAATRVTLDEALFVTPQTDPDLIALDEALNKLCLVDERKSRVVELKFFGGLTVEETAEELKVSQETVMRDWKLAKAWLLRELKRGGQNAA